MQVVDYKKLQIYRLIIMNNQKDVIKDDFERRKYSLLQYSIAGLSLGFTACLPYIFFTSLRIKKGNNAIVRLWQATALAGVFGFGIIHFGRQFEIHEQVLIKKYLSGLSDEELRQFNIEKYKNAQRKGEDRESVQIKEKWGGK